MNVEILNQSVAACFAGTTSFPEHLGKVASQGVDWYSANQLFRVTTLYGANGSHHQVEWPELDLPPIADAFDGGEVLAAIRASQQGQVDYPTFLKRIAAAGAVYYTVHLKGKKAIYFGRHGDFHIEEFPR